MKVWQDYNLGPLMDEIGMRVGRDVLLEAFQKMHFTEQFALCALVEQVGDYAFKQGQACSNPLRT